MKIAMSPFLEGEHDIFILLTFIVHSITVKGFKTLEIFTMKTKFLRDEPEPYKVASAPLPLKKSVHYVPLFM